MQQQITWHLKTSITHEAILSRYIIDYERKHLEKSWFYARSHEASAVVQRPNPQTKRLTNRKRCQSLQRNKASASTYMTAPLIQKNASDFDRLKYFLTRLEKKCSILTNQQLLTLQKKKPKRNKNINIKTGRSNLRCEGRQVWERELLAEPLSSNNGIMWGEIYRVCIWDT